MEHICLGLFEGGQKVLLCLCMAEHHLSHRSGNRVATLVCHSSRCFSVPAAIDEVLVHDTRLPGP